MNHEGYTCPHYLLSRPSFSSACDVFSWGVVVCELITGNISCNESQHYLMYKMNKTSSLEDDADACVDWGCGRSLRKMAELALKCMRFAPDRRPSIGRIVKEVQMIINDERQVNRSIDIEVSPRSKSRQRCCFCGEVSKKFVNCCGSKKHTHCQNCLQSGLERNINRCRYGGLRCLKDGCGLKSTQRITSVAVSTQLRWIRLLGTEICMPLVQYKSGDSFEVDELRTFVGSKKRETWVISAKSRNTGKIVCVKVGRRNKKNLQELIDAVLVLNPIKIFTDRLPMYRTIIPNSIHSVKRYATNRLERFHLTLRTHLKRLSRRTICYSKSEEILACLMNIYIQ